jgi:hypothetical protein
MGPVATSAVTSLLLVLLTNAAQWAATHGVIESDQIGTVTTAGSTILLLLIAAAVGYFKTRMVTREAAIAQVNTQENGVKVVSAAVDAPTVWKPLDPPAPPPSK